MRMIFVNLPVKNLSASMAFFEALGFKNNPQFTDETAACMVIEENIFVMLLTEEKFKSFINGDIATNGVEVLTALSAANREECDAFVEKALANGGKPWKPAMDLGFMYGTSFQDPDGHVWELSYVDMEAAMAMHGGGA